MKKLVLFLILQSIFSFAQDFKTPYEKGNGNQTTTYEEMVKFYDDLDKNFESISVVEKGKTHKAKVKFYDASSKEFDISIDDNIIENQMKTFFIK